MDFVQKLVNHIRNGTLFNRIINYREIKREKDWRIFINSNRDYIIKKLYKTIKIKLHKNHLLSKAIYLNTFEYKEIGFLKKNLKKGDVFVDVGANIGLFTLIASRLVGKKGLVISFEPTMKTYEKLIENIRINNKVAKNIKTYNIALSDQNSTSTLYVNDEYHDALNSLVKTDNYIKEQNIVCETLDLFVSRYNLKDRSVYIKIDVEGYEVPVIKGLESEFKKGFSPTLIMEFNDSNANRAGFSCDQLMNILSQYGYKFYELDNSSDEVKLKEKVFYTYENIVAVK